MASSGLLADIDENFLQCSICLGQLKDPKSLPCLHRYCRECLNTLIRGQCDQIQCPECREEHELPESGVDGLRTDFNTKNIVEFVELKKSIKEYQVRVCFACSKKVKVTGYCFRCNDFLCQSCYDYHVTSSVLQDHVPHTLALCEIESRNLTVEKLASLKEIPKCNEHPQRESQLCCVTCGNESICMACGTFGSHKGHDLHEITSLAKTERAKLDQKMGKLKNIEGKIYQRQLENTKIKTKIACVVTEQEELLQREFSREERNIKTEIVEKVEEYSNRKAEIEDSLNETLAGRKQEHEKEKLQLEQNYDKTCNQDKKEAEVKLQKLGKENREETDKLTVQLASTNVKLKDLLSSLHEQQTEKLLKIKELSDQFDTIVKRFESLTATVSSITAAKHDWTDVQCIADICSAIGPLIEDADRDALELETLEDFSGVKDLALIDRKAQIRITEVAETAVDIEVLSRGGWDIQNISASKDGSIVVTGISGGFTHITAINMGGTILRHNIIESHTHTDGRYCDFLSRFQVATVDAPNEIGVYDIRDGSYVKKNISDVIGIWPEDQLLTCVAVDPVNKHIIVGGSEGRDVYVFDEKLNYLNTMTLPEEIKSSWDITVHEGKLLVCAYGSEGVYAVTLELDGSQCELVYQLANPDDDDVYDGDDDGEDDQDNDDNNGDDSHGADNDDDAESDDDDELLPQSVCTDRKGFIYILWCWGDNSVIVQYSQDGAHLMTKPLDVEYTDMTTLKTDTGEELLLVTHSGQICRLPLLND